MCDVAHPHLTSLPARQFPIKGQVTWSHQTHVLSKTLPFGLQKGLHHCAWRKRGSPSLVGEKKVCGVPPTARFEKNSWPSWPKGEKFDNSKNVSKWESLCKRFCQHNLLDACLWREISTSEFQLEMLVPFAAASAWESLCSTRNESKNDGIGTCSRRFPWNWLSGRWRPRWSWWSRWPTWPQTWWHSTCDGWPWPT